LNNANLQSIAERLAASRGLSAKPLDSLVDVEIDWEAVVTFVRSTYAYLNLAYDDEVGIVNAISEDQFVSVIMAIIAKRVQWVRSRVYGIREGASVAIGNTVPILGPIFQLVYSFGRVKSHDANVTFVPAFDGLKAYAKVDVEAFRRYMILIGKLKHYYPFSEGMPASDEGTWAYLLNAVPVSTGVEILGVTSEGKPGDAFLAGIVRHARLMAGFFYGSSYGVVASPDTTLVEFLSAYGKGIGEG